MEFAIYAPSEGWWNNILGWCNEVESATRYTEKQKEKQMLPIARNNDSNWICLKFED